MDVPKTRDLSRVNMRPLCFAFMNVIYSAIIFALPTIQLFLGFFLSLKLFLALFKGMVTSLRHDPPFYNICIL
jgi:hypothetical protein